MSDFHCTGFCSKRYGELAACWAWLIFISSIQIWILDRCFQIFQLSAGCLLLSQVWLPGECIESVTALKVLSHTGKAGWWKRCKLKNKYLALLKDQYMQTFVYIKKKLISRARLADVSTRLMQQAQPSPPATAKTPSVFSLAVNGRSRNLSLLLALPFQSRKYRADLQHFQKCSSNFPRQVDGWLELEWLRSIESSAGISPLLSTSTSNDLFSCFFLISSIIYSDYKVNSILCLLYYL